MNNSTIKSPASQRVINQLNPGLQADDFWQTYQEFQLGHLITEQPHPLTTQLAHHAQHDLAAGIEVLQQVDIQALAKLAQYINQLMPLQASIRQLMLNTEHRVFIAGCGATGRLALTLEVLWRRAYPQQQDRVIGLMAGGDTALIRAIEGFEDHPEYGARQLQALGFRPGDLLIACTEGGETPFVLGAADYAAQLSATHHQGVAPWLLFCNPITCLTGIKRCQQALNNPEIESVSLPLGPMALTGSTRMQASTALMLAVGLCLLKPQEDLIRQVNRFSKLVEALDLSFLIPFIVAEASIYQQQERVLYCTDKRYAITLLTDTTERAPTFSLTPFTNKHRFEDNPSWCYLSLTGSRSASQAWQQLLERSPRALEWPETRHLTGLKRFFGFDISECANGWLAKLEGQQHQFVIELNTDQITFQLGDQQGQLTVPDNELFQHLLLKLVINIHSTLVMGRLGRYQANLMTYVYPSNNKLIDRAIRYAGYLLNQQGIHYDYQTIGEALFDSLADIQPDQPAVLTLVNHLLTRQTPVNSRTD